MERIEQLKAQYPGKIIAVYQGEIIGVCDTREEVMELVRRVVPIQQHVTTGDPRTINPLRWHSRTGLVIRHLPGVAVRTHRDINGGLGQVYTDKDRFLFHKCLRSVLSLPCEIRA